MTGRDREQRAMEWSWAGWCGVLFGLICYLAKQWVVGSIFVYIGLGCWGVAGVIYGKSE